MLTRRERILRTMKGEPVDRLAVSPRFWKFCMAYYGAATLENMLRSADEFEWDMLFYPPAGVRNYFGASIPSPETLPEAVTCTGTLVEDDDVRVVHREFTTPAGRLTDTWYDPKPGRGYGISPTANPKETLLKCPGDLEALRYLRGQVMPEVIQEFMSSDRQIGDNGFLIPYVRSPFDGLSYVYPAADCMMLPYDDPQFLRDLLAFLQEMCLDDIRAHLQAGAASIYLSGFHVSLSVGWSPQVFREFFLPLIKEQVDLTHNGGALAHYYDDGKCMALLPMLLEVGVDVFETCTPWPAGDFEPRAAKALVGDRLTLMGYVDIETVLHRGTPELVEQTVREAVEILGCDGRYVIGTSDGILAQTPLENVCAFFAAGRKYGALVLTR